MEDMTKDEFLSLCDRIFKRYGFLRRGRHYYIDLESDIIGSIFFQSSDYGAAYYLNCGFGIKSEIENLPYPKRHDFQMSWRIDVLGKERLPYLPNPEKYMTEVIKYEKYTAEEIGSYLTLALDEWVIPAIRNGYAYILGHEELYGRMLNIARILKKIKE